MKKSTLVLLAGSLFLLFVVGFSMYLAVFSMSDLFITGILSSIIDIGMFLVFAMVVTAAILGVHRLLDRIRTNKLLNREK